MAGYYSDLQVTTDERYPKYPLPEQAEPEAYTPLKDPYSEKTAIDDRSAVTPEKWHGRKRICGLESLTLWTILAIFIVLVTAAAVGGGVGTSLSNKHSSHANSTENDNTTPSSSATRSSTSITSLSTSTPPTTTTSLPISISTRTTLSPTQTLLVDCPSSNFTIYTPPSTSQLFRKICSRTFISQTTNANVVKQPTTSLNDCIDLCASYNEESAAAIAAGTARVCNAVCWRATIEGDDWPGQCFGFMTVNRTSSGSNSGNGEFEYDYDERCDSAALIN